MALAVTAKFRSVDVLINNAGAFASRTIDENTTTELDQQIGATLRSLFSVSESLCASQWRDAEKETFSTWAPLRD